MPPGTPPPARPPAPASYESAPPPAEQPYGRSYEAASHEGVASPYGVTAPYQPVPVASGRGSGWRIGDIAVIVGAALVVFFSFAPFVAYDDRLIEQASPDSRTQSFTGVYNAWSTEMFMAPLTWWVVIAGIGLLALASWRSLTGREQSLLRFSTGQLQLGLALFATLILVGYAFSNKQQSFGFDQEEFFPFPLDPHFAWGGYVMLAGAVVALLGALFNHFDLAPELEIRLPRPGQTPSVPGQAPPSVPGQTSPPASGAGGPSAGDVR